MYADSHVRWYRQDGYSPRRARKGRPNKGGRGKLLDAKEKFPFRSESRIENPSRVRVDFSGIPLREGDSSGIDASRERLPTDGCWEMVTSLDLRRRIHGSWIYLGTYEVEPSPRSPSIYTRARARRRRRQGSARHVEPCKTRKSTGVSAMEIWGDSGESERA